MRFCVLGSVEVAVEGRLVALGSERQRTILAVLLAAGGEAVSTDGLIDALWGGSPPASARKSLQSHVSRLRRTLASMGAGGALVSTADGYRAEVRACELDAARFEELVSRARHHLRGAEPATAVDLLDEADGLWRGPAFGELADHDRVRAEALRLEQLRSSAAADRVDSQLALGRHEDVIGELEAAAAREPLAERVHGQLMLALYRSGQQAEALATYRRLQQRLGDEVGIDPSVELQRLHEGILRQDVGPVALATALPAGQRNVTEHTGAGSRPMPTAAPRVASTLLGRDQDVVAVADLVTATSLVTLIGTGGVGKTRLAQQVAAVAAERFDDVVVCRLDAVRDPDSVAVALIDGLDALDEGGRPAEETLIAAVGSRRLLLLIDNCEHVLASVSLVATALLERCPNLVILATSREPLHLPGERVWQVAPLSVPPADASPAEVRATPAGALFCARAEAAEPAFALTDGNAGAVGELCRRLDGIPLAIELAAARVRAISPGDLLERIDERFSLLTAGPRHDTDRHRTLHAVVAWSYDLLTDAEARLFDRLSVFAGSFALSAAEQVCAGEPIPEGEVAGVLAELVDRCMVVVERDGDRIRYRLLDTLRAYGAGGLAEAGDAKHYQRAHAAYHVAFAESLGPRVRGADEGPVLAEIDVVVDDLRMAHGWLVAEGDVDGALRLPAALSNYIVYRQRDEMVTWAERALELPGARAQPSYPAALATVALGATRRGELDRARRDAEAALARAEADRDPGTAASALYALASVALYEGRLDDILELADRNAVVAEQTGEDFHRAMSCMGRTLAHLYRGDATAAAAHAVEYREAAEASGNHGLRASALYSHGEALLDIDPAAAEPLLEQAIEVATGIDSHTKGVALVSLASLCGRRGDTDRALELFHDVIAHWRRLGDWTHQLTTLRNLVELLVRLGADEAAALLHGAVTTAARPSFGVEAERLEAAWAQLEDRLGSQAPRAAERGRRLTTAQTIDEALSTLDELRSR